MEGFLTSGAVADVVVSVLVVQAAALLALRALWRRGPALRHWLPMTVAGGALAAALGSALKGLHWGWVGSLLAVALLAHTLHLFLHWEQSPS